MDLNTIMSNIYGENASQSFDNISISGGHIERRLARVKYLDQDAQEPNNTSITNSYSKPNKYYTPNMRMNMTGGADDDFEELVSIFAIKDKRVNDFIEAFQLHRTVLRQNPYAIIVIPTKDKLKQMSDEVNAALKEKGLTLGTTEAANFMATHDFTYKNYVIDIFVGKDNDGRPYRMDNDFPKKGSNTVLKRTTRANTVYYFVFKSADDITVATSDDMKNALKLKLLAKVRNNNYVLYGDLPPNDGRTKSNIMTVTMSGGNKDNQLRKYFLSLVSHYNDLDKAAYHFIGAIAAGSEANPKKLAQYYSGDYIHTAFSIIADNKPFSINKNVSNNKLNKMHSIIINNYTPVKSIIKMDKVNAVLPAIYKNAKLSKTGLQASKTFISNIKKIYNSINAPKYMMLADIATSLCRYNNNAEAVNNAYQLMNEIESLPETDKEKNDFKTNYLNSTVKLSDKAVISPLMDIVYTAISSSPFIGFVAKEYTPMLMAPINKVNRKALQRKAFEDSYNIFNDKNVSFEILYDETNDTNDTTEKHEPKNKIIDKDENDSDSDEIESSENEDDEIEDGKHESKDDDSEDENDGRDNVKTNLQNETQPRTNDIDIKSFF